MGLREAPEQAAVPRRLPKSRHALSRLQSDLARQGRRARAIEAKANLCRGDTAEVGGLEFGPWVKSRSHNTFGVAERTSHLVTEPYELRRVACADFQGPTSREKRVVVERANDRRQVRSPQDQ
jgi:hypothetical protein